MNALAWIGGSVFYALMGSVCARLVAGHLAWRFARLDTEYDYKSGRYISRAEPNGDQWFGAWCAGLAAGVVWPLIGAMLCFPSERWSVGEERRQVQRRQAERIAELEKELGL